MQLVDVKLGLENSARQRCGSETPEHNGCASQESQGSMTTI